MEYPNGKPVMPICLRQKPINVCLFGHVCPRSEASDIRRSPYHWRSIIGRRRITTAKGLTFIELIVALTLLTVAMLGYFRLFNVALDSQYRDTQEMIASNLAQGFISEIMTKDFVDPQFPLDTTLGPNTGESNRSNFDDVDDYNAWSEKPPVTVGGLPMDGAGGRPDYSAFTRRARVVYCNITGSDIVEVAGPSDYKKATVTVSGPYVTDINIDELKVKPAP